MRTINGTFNGITRGFTLIELLIVLVLALILSAAAFPAYTEFAVRARRVEGQAALLLLMQQQERYHSQRGSYLAFAADATDDEAKAFRWWSGSTASRSAYEVEGKACEGESIRDCVQLVAKPGTARVDPAFRDEACGNLILTSNGLRLATGASISCWR
jgi:type IV pilus assembly protein PilE